MGEQMKRCSRCGQYKPLSQYNQHADTPLVHRQPYCRQCQREYYREHANTIGRSVGGTASSDTQRKAYAELYAYYKTYRHALEAYMKSFDNPTERLDFEYIMGL